MSVSWRKNVRRSEGGPFYKFQGVSVPAAVKSLYGLHDGDEISLAVQFGSSLEVIEKPLTSGGEVAVGKDLNERLQKFAKQFPASFVQFTLTSNKVPGNFLSHDDRRQSQIEFDRGVENARSNRKSRLARLKAAPKIPLTETVTVQVYKRNPDVVAERLDIAEGVCEDCGSEAPFFRRSTGEPYLEVHHIHTLAEGGHDTVENTTALCPNCHRKAHYG